MSYAPLHVHDAFGSIGDSVLMIKDFVAKAKRYGIKHAAITNHGSLSTFMSFYEECKCNQINPIIGCEIYLCDDMQLKDKEHADYWHLVLLAKDYEGLSNLIRIHNETYKDGFYSKPRADFSLLQKYSGHLVCLTGCVASPLAKAYADSNPEKIISCLDRLQSIFRNDLFLEVQPGRFSLQIAYNDFLVRLSELLGIRLIATNDIHYLDKKDCYTHDLHVKDSRKYTGADFVYPDTVYYLMDEKELAELFVRTGTLTKDKIAEAIANTIVVAEKCNIVIPEEHFMPVFDPGIDEMATLEKLCMSALKKLPAANITGTSRDRYSEHLDYELDTIRQLGFAGYFLIVYDIIKFCDKNGIARGPGRGSCAGSLVSHLLGITAADPLCYEETMFERFLSVHRSGYPDIDMDLDPERKSEVYDYIIEKYGENRTCFVSTYNIRKARAAIKAACRLLNVDLSVSNMISKAIPYVRYDEMGEKHTEISIDEAIRSVDGFDALASQYPAVVNLAKSIENLPSSAGIHPAGIIISPIDITSRYPLIRAKDKKIMATSLDLKDVEKLSGVKIDLLSLSSLSVISRTMADAGFIFDYNNPKLFKDDEVWKLIASDKTTGIFQISSPTYRSRMPQLHPSSIKELAACLALVRGPCISNGMDQKYIAIINGQEKEEKIHELYWQATKSTHGVLIYQEQILKLLMNFGFGSETAYNILKAVSKKKVEKIKSFKESFIDLAADKLVSKDIAERIWSIIETSGLYAFNAAHATSYALLTYCSAYLKLHYPLEYMSSLLTKEYGKAATDINTDAIYQECIELGIKFLPPDINKSGYGFKVEDGRIRMGLCSIKGLGASSISYIKSLGSFESFGSFIERCNGRTINKRTVLLLIAAGTFGNIEKKRPIQELADYYMHTVRKEKDWNRVVRLGNDKNAILSLSDSSNTIQSELFQSRLVSRLLRKVII